MTSAMGRLRPPDVLADAAHALRRQAAGLSALEAVQAPTGDETVMPEKTAAIASAPGGRLAIVSAEVRGEFDPKSAVDLIADCTWIIVHNALLNAGEPWIRALSGHEIIDTAVLSQIIHGGPAPTLEAATARLPRRVPLMMPVERAGATAELAGVLSTEAKRQGMERCVRIEAACTAELLEMARRGVPVDRMAARQMLSRMKGRSGAVRRTLALTAPLYALLSASERDGRVRARWHQIGTATGRMSTTDPNLLGLPRALRSLIRPSGDHVLIRADFAQVEPLIAAALSGDKALRAFIESGDVYRRVAAELLYHKSEAEITDAERSQAKVVVLGTLYGMSERGLAKRLTEMTGRGVSAAEAHEVYRRVYARFRHLREWQREVYRQACRTGKTVTVTGRQRDFGTEKLTWQSAINAPVQGTGADLLKAALTAVSRASRPISAAPILAWHDEIILECPVECADEAVRLTAAAMKRAAQALLGLPARVKAETLVPVSTPSSNLTQKLK